MQGHSIQIFKYFSQVVEIVLYDPALKDFSMIFELLLENGTNPLTKTRTGVSPLYIASKNGHKDVVRILLKFGADVTRVCVEVCAYMYHMCVLYIIIHDPFIYIYAFF